MHLGYLCLSSALCIFWILRDLQQIPTIRECLRIFQSDKSSWVTNPAEPRAEPFPESSRVVPRCVRAWGLSHGSIPCDAEVGGAAWKDGKTVEVEDWDWTRRGLSTPVIAAAAAASYHCNSSRHVTLLSQQHRETRLHYTVPQKSGRTTVHHHHHHHRAPMLVSVSINRPLFRISLNVNYR